MMAWFPGIGCFRCFSFAVAKTEEELHEWISVVVFGFSKSAFSTNRRRASARYVLAAKDDVSRFC